ncbi:MAG TPA: hypothetical protein VK614_14645 [Allosphingosinicella sp.]|nr:hypothetical protein [Allosphingosinicella sp.]
MAAREHRVSRRVLLGAACAVLSLAEGPAHPEPGRRIPSSAHTGHERWNRALTRFRRAQSIIDAAVHEPDQDRYDTLLDTFTAALRRLLRTPAPDLPALALKIELAIDQAAWESTGGEASMAALKRDARRLAARERIC